MVAWWDSREVGQAMRTKEIVDLVLRDHRINCRRSINSTISHSRPLLQYLPAKRITTEDIEAYKQLRICEHNRMPGTVRNELTILKRGYTLAKEQGRLNGHEPKIKFPQVHNTRSIISTVEQVQTIIKVLRGICPALADLVLWMCLTGWRRGECADFTWTMVSQDRYKVELPPSKTKNLMLKTVQVGQQAKEILDRRWEDRYREYVFHRGGKRLYHYRGPWMRAIIAADISELRPHDLRRFFATQGTQAGVPQKTLMSIGGWKTTSTFDRYCIINSQMQSEAQDRIAEAISQ